MLVVADSGSTKCDWIFASPSGDVEMSTMGFNPMFHSAQVIETTLQQNEPFVKMAQKASQVYFYGAGCSSKSRNAIVEEGLKSLFPAANIVVKHDLDGAVYAACQGEPGIACILGTGSNSAFFDGKSINEHVPALGYILGDEGSGSYFGKQLLAKHFYHQLPRHLEELFKDTYPKLTKDTVFTNTYMRPNANVYLASFMKFLSDNRKDPYVQKMVYRGLSEFIDIHIWQYRDYKSYPVHFVGSIAYFFENTLKKVAETHRINLGRIIRKPVSDLVAFHNDGFQ